MTPHFFYISDITNSSTLSGKSLRKKSMLENLGSADVAVTVTVTVTLTLTLTVTVTVTVTVIVIVIVIVKSEQV